MASPLMKKYAPAAAAKLEQLVTTGTPAPNIPSTKLLSEKLRESEETVKQPRQAMRRLDFSKDDGPEQATDERVTALEAKVDTITDMLAQILQQQKQNATNAAHPPAQTAPPDTKTALPATSPATTAATAAAQQHDQPQNSPNSSPHSPTAHSPDTVTVTAAQKATSFLAGGQPNDRTTALNRISVHSCETTLRKYKNKITTVEQLAAKIKAEYPAWTQKITTALEKRGAPCRDDLLGMHRSFAAEFTITKQALATATFWCAISDQDSPKASIAAGVLNDFMGTEDPIALMDNCNHGLAGTATGLHRAVTAGCGDLTTTAGWDILMTATLSAFGYSTTVTQQVRGMITEWREQRQQNKHLSQFLQDFQTGCREINRVCEQGGCTTRALTETDCLDALRDAVQPDLLECAEYRLMQIKDMDYDEITYPMLKAALVKVQRDQDEASTPTKAPAVMLPKTPTKPTQQTQTKEEQQAKLTQDLQKYGICLFHVAGRCNKGGDCDYKHQKPEEVGLDPKDYLHYQPATRFLKKKDITMAPAAASPTEEEDKP